jgi:N-acetylneuraminate synthase/N,N'-diacetyllegionaminate synthase
LTGQRGINIAGRKIGESVLVVAEAGVNHNGSLKRALRMVDEAARARADAIKFQTFKAERLVSAGTPKTLYQRKSTAGRDQLEMLEALELSHQDFATISERARKRGIVFLSTPFDEESADFLETLGVPAFKVASGDLTNHPFLEYVAKKGRPIILSTGMSSLEEVGEAIAVIRSQGNEDIVLLHCVSSYPSDPADCNLRAMQTLRGNFNLPVGFSDHTRSIEVPLAATALGAVVIEKHFTLSRRLPGPDQRASLEPKEFRRMVSGIRMTEQAIGSSVKAPTESERDLRLVARRSAVAAVEIPKEEVITREMVVFKRPGTGIPPNELPILLGKRAARGIKRDEVLTWDMVV